MLYALSYRSVLNCYTHFYQYPGIVCGSSFNVYHVFFIMLFSSLCFIITSLFHHAVLSLLLFIILLCYHQLKFLILMYYRLFPLLS